MYILVGMKKLLISILILLAAFFAFAEDSEDTKTEANQVITKINFNGLTKTKDSYLQRRYKKYIGRPIAEIDLRELETELRAEGVFDKIEIDFSKEADSTAIEIYVDEKITFIPLPFAMVSSSGLIAGGMVMDTNAFGVKDTLMLGGFYASTSITGMGMFSKPAIEYGRPGFSIFSSVSKNSPMVKDIYNEDVLDFQNFAIVCSVNIFEQLGKFNKVGISLGYNYLNNKDENSVESIGSAIIGSAGLNYTFSKSDWNGYFMSTSGINLSASISKYFRLEDASGLASFVQNYSTAYSIQKPIFSERVRLCTQFSSAFSATLSGKSAHIAEAKKRGSAGVTILSGDFKTDRIFGGTVGFEAAVKKFKFGLLSVYGNYELVWADDFSESLTLNSLDKLIFCHGPSAGLCLYLSKIAFPALSTGLSYNVSEKYWQYSFSLGMSM